MKDCIFRHQSVILLSVIVTATECATKAMCIIFVAVEQHKDYPLIIAANRDEFYQRPTQPSHWWDEPETILAGKDLQAGGSWMGVHRNGDIAALTNIRNPAREQPQARSRGELVVNYLSRTTSEAQFEQQLSKSREAYNGYNLLYGNVTRLQVYNNHTNRPTPLATGFHGLSNSALNTPWPKVRRGVTRLQEYISTATMLNKDALFNLLQDNTPAAQHELPDTGVPLEWEQRLSSIFIASPEYGTRSSTLLMINQRCEVTWLELEYDHGKKVSPPREFQWKIVQE
ncbi:MAG: NRDE family protein [Pseudomonadota bacterium]|nr:NRDE family protein [Pseudomonadota bacterium]